MWIYKDGALLRHSERSAHFFRYLFPGDTLLYRLSHVEYTHMYTSIVCTHATHFTLFNELLVKSMRATTFPQFFVWPPEGSAHSKILHSVFESLCPSTLNANSKLYKQKQQQQQNKSLSHTSMLDVCKWSPLYFLTLNKSNDFSNLQVTKLNSSLLYAHSQTSFRQASFQYLFLRLSYFIDELWAQAGHGEYNSTTDM